MQAQLKEKDDRNALVLARTAVTLHCNAFHVLRTSALRIRLQISLHLRPNTVRCAHVRLLTRTHIVRAVACCRGSRTGARPRLGTPFVLGSDSTLTYVHSIHVGPTT